jgi:hypothetical protein
LIHSTQIITPKKSSKVRNRHFTSIFIASKKISYVNVTDEEARAAMKDARMNDWLINTSSELYDYFRKGYASQSISSAVEEVTGRKPISFSQFAKDYAEASIYRNTAAFFFLFIRIFSITNDICTDALILFS